jgi:hypothetical protein
VTVKAQHILDRFRGYFSPYFSFLIHHGLLPSRYGLEDFIYKTWLRRIEPKKLSLSPALLFLALTASIALSGASSPFPPQASKKVE